MKLLYLSLYPSHTFILAETFKFLLYKMENFSKVFVFIDLNKIIHLKTKKNQNYKKSFGMVKTCLSEK